MNTWSRIIPVVDRDPGDEPEWSCKHGYFHAESCPNCDVPCHWPELDIDEVVEPC
jgi:hypothetical protein